MMMASELELMLRSGPVYCLTSDTDWASDTVLRTSFDVFRAAKRKLTVFATNASAELREDDPLIQVGLHPNFLPGSSHGSSEVEVIDHMQKLFPAAETFKAHSYYDHCRLTEIMAERGFTYDANIALYRQEYCVPLRHSFINWRFPTWLDDNIHWNHGGSWRFNDLEAELLSPGLKIINLHPVSVALNLDSAASWEARRPLLRAGDPDRIKAGMCPGHGVRTFLMDLLEFLDKGSQSYQLCELNALASSSQNSDVMGRPVADRDYQGATDEEKQSLVKAAYEKMPAADRYITSRDYNNRELEIHQIRNYVVGNRVLDLGCGNGYTLLSLAAEKNGNYVGVDFSQNLIDGAHSLLKNEFSSIERPPKFVCGDAISFLDGVDVGEFDTIITERLIVNLPSEKAQYDLIDEIVDRLASGGAYLMVEGSAIGFAALNRVRAAVGLATIPDRYPGNESSLKLDDRKLASHVQARGDADIEDAGGMSFYSVASKVLHPLLVAPAEPTFKSRINDTARRVQEALAHERIELGTIGAASFWVIRKR
jgi:SAM-dependent methyltransferase